MSELNYYNKKYLKYKNKYLQAKLLINNNITTIKDSEKINKQIGGDTPFNKMLLDKNINFFTNSDMSEYLNPIYGLIFQEAGFISNNYFLHKSKLIEHIKINKIINEIFGVIQPTNDLLFFKPIDYGRYIAIKYIFLKNPHLITFFEKNSKYQLNFKSNDMDKIINYINVKNKDNILLKSYFSLQSKSKEDFHLLLYCFWWTANDYKGILSYYEGINEIICIINRCISISTLKNKPIPIPKYNIIDTNNININNDFEKKILEITNKQFKIYHQGYSKNFCNDTVSNTYRDCGEVTARNLINLMCFNGTTIDITQLQKFNPIPELTEYYRVFNNFSLQSSIDPLIIFDEKLNAQDAWSKLIIYYAKSNLSFTRNCINKNKNLNQYELTSGMNIDNTYTNFEQLIKNLLPGINNLNDIKTDFIESVEDKTVMGGGIGSIVIQCINNIKIHIELKVSHYEMLIINDFNNKLLNDSNFNNEQKNYINILSNNTKFITSDNYLWFNINSIQLVDLLNSSVLDNEFKIKLFKLSLIQKYNNNTRVKITIKNNFLMYILSEIKNNEYTQKIMNEYKYESNDFNFIKMMPYLTNLNVTIINDNLTSIDLTPLTNIISIGNNFLYKYTSLTNIDLTSLTNITSIGNNFLSGCKSLTNINLSSLTNITSIGHHFLSGCASLKNINLSSLTNIKSIGHHFLSGCTSLSSIDLTPLTNITIIGDNFLFGCTSLTSIDLTPLTNIKSIEQHLLMVPNIDVPPIIKNKSIGNYFLSGCIGLTSIDLSPFSIVENIGNYFLSGCIGLTSIDLTPLTNVEIIGHYFLFKCIGLTSIDLTPLTNVEIIGTMFLSGCTGLSSIDLSPLKKINFIGKQLLFGCTGFKLIYTENQKKILNDNFNYFNNSGIIKEIAN